MVRQSKIALIEDRKLTIAETLSVVMARIATLEEEEKKLRAELFDNLKRQGVKSVKLEDGTLFVITERQTLKVKDPEKAFAWAMENPQARMKIDTAAALSVFRKELKMPKFFTKVTTEYLTIKNQ